MKRKRNRSESNHVRSKISRWARFLSKDGDWDYGFLIEMECMKLQQMEEYFRDKDTFVGIEYVKRDLRICLQLLDIVQERDDLNIELSPLDLVPFKDKDGHKWFKSARHAFHAHKRNRGRQRLTRIPKAHAQGGTLTEGTALFAGRQGKGGRFGHNDRIQ